MTWEDEDGHVQQAAEYTNQIDVEGVTVYAIGYQGFGIEVTMDTPDGWGLLGDYTFEDEAELQSVVNDLDEELTKHESFGFDRNDQQLYIAGVLDNYGGGR